ncbi:MAG: CRISPR-associated helicase/endonuclease Cas3 [Desulfobacterales bacterium]|nr:MAG: CRISPR-associated helicase/endonuclease Cas3 [Desulfobacterales bacterium]
MGNYFAHSLEGESQEKWQTIEAHLLEVAKKAKAFGANFGSGDFAYLAGLWHDIGKYSPEFQRRLGVARDSDAHIEQISGKPDHSTAGAQYANGRLAHSGKLLAYAIAGHHAGLPNGKDNHRSCLYHRLKKQIPDWSACPEALLQSSAPTHQPPFFSSIQGKRPSKRFGFQASFFIRMIYSCLVDADFLNTEEFITPEKTNWRKDYPSLRALNEKLGSYLDSLVRDAKPKEINKHRSEILQHCLENAPDSPGLFSLTVPTGGGKTLSSLAFAMKHAIQHQFERIIYVIPYTSIIEQNAAVFRDVLGDAAVLEHHSSFDFRDEKDEDRRSRLASENWDAPLIVTTSVQFFESLFHNRPSRCRKLHNISKSVVILDEAQMLPVSFLRPCIEALREFSLFYNTSIVLCTATQPALSSKMFKWRLEGVREIIPEPEQYYTLFKRVETQFVGKKTDDEIAGQLSDHQQVLCIVNTRKHARLLYEKLKGEGCYHLSALMCPVHRCEKLKQIREALNDGKPCRVISTQLVEAGVDIDFPVVYRSAAGIDAIAQAAGRCNRENELPEGGQVFVFIPEGGLPPGDFRLNAEAAESVMRHHRDILSPEAVKEYFETIFWRKGDDQLDRKDILKALTAGMAAGDFPFKDVAGKFNLIEDGMEPVIVQYSDEAKKLVARLRYSEHPGSVARKLQRFIVQIPPRVHASLVRFGAVESIQKRFFVLMNMDIYNDELGLCPEDPTFYKVESMIL